MYIFLNVTGIWSYFQHSIIIFERPENILSEENIADVWLRSVPQVQSSVCIAVDLVNCLYRVCVCVCVCVSVCVRVCVMCVCVRMCLCVN